MGLLPGFKTSTVLWAALPLSLVFGAGCSSDLDSAPVPSSSSNDDSARSSTEAETDGDTGEGCPAHPAPPVCDEVSAAPSRSFEISDFAARNAVPLSCDAPERWVWDFVLDMAGSSRIVAMGEVHGSAQIGPASAALLTELVETGTADTLAVEMGMDLDGALESYLSGDSAPLEAYGSSSWADAMFWRTLPDAARSLREGGFELRVFGVDVPWAVAPMVEKLRALAGELPGEVEQALLQDLPTPVPFGEDVGPEDLAAACDYRARIQKRIEALCSGLEDAVCLDIARFASGLCFAAQINAPTFWEDPALDMNRWLAEREKLIFANYLAIFAEHPEARIYAHMGGFHAGQSGGSVGQMLAEELGRHDERIFSLFPAYGEGSAVLADGEERPLEAQPPQLEDALPRLESKPHYLSIRAPGFDCAQNPFFEAQNPELGGTYGSGFDGFVVFEKLTPERPPKEHTAHLEAGFAIRQKIAALDGLLKPTI